MADAGSAEGPRTTYGQGYLADVDAIRQQEYPLLNGMNLAHGRRERA